MTRDGSHDRARVDYDPAVPRTKPALALLASIALAALAACDGTPDDDGAPLLPPVPCSASTATPTTSVRLAGMQFVPYCAAVGAGVPLTFSNVDSVAHTVTADAGQPEAFDSGLLQPGQRFTFAFSKAETVRVHDRLHPGMAGIVIVQ